MKSIDYERRVVAFIDILGHDEQVIYGPAMVEAYEMESKVWII